MDIDLRTLLSFIKESNRNLKISNSLMNDPIKATAFIKKNAKKIDKNITIADENILFYIQEIELAKLLVTEDNIKFKNKSGQNALFINKIPVKVLQFYIEKGMDINGCYKSDNKEDIDYFKSLLYPIHDQTGQLYERIILGLENIKREIPPTIMFPIFRLLNDELSIDKKPVKTNDLLLKLKNNQFDFAKSEKIFISHYEKQRMIINRYKLTSDVRNLEKQNEILYEIYLNIFKRNDMLANNFKENFMNKFIPELTIKFQKIILDDVFIKNSDEKSYNVVKKTRL